MASLRNGYRLAGQSSGSTNRRSSGRPTARRPNMSKASRSLHTQAGTRGVTLGYSMEWGSISARTTTKPGSLSSMESR